MGIIKKFKDYFTTKQELSNQDVDNIKDIFTELFDELESECQLEYKNDFTFHIQLSDDKYSIKGNISINPNIRRMCGDNGNYRSGSMIVKETFHQIIYSNAMKGFKKHIKSTFNIKDTLDEIDNLKKSTNGMSLGPSAKLIMLDMIAQYTFTITSK